MEHREFVVNEKTYRLLLPPVRKSMLLANRITVLMGGVLATLGKDIKEGGMKSFADAISSLDPEKMDKLFMDAISESKLHAGTTPVHNEFEFEKYFQTNREDVYPVCMKCLWECTKDFLPRSLGTFAQGAKTKFMKEFLSQMGGQSNTGSDALSGPGCAPGSK